MLPSYFHCKLLLLIKNPCLHKLCPSTSDSRTLKVKKTYFRFHVFVLFILCLCMCSHLSVLRFYFFLIFIIFSMHFPVCRDICSPTKARTCAPCSGSPVLTTAPPGEVHCLQFLNKYLRPRKKTTHQNEYNIIR